MFNLALVYQRMSAVTDAIREWKKYLAVDKDSAWATEARQHLAEMEKLRASHDHAQNQVTSDPQKFLDEVRTDEASVNPELFENVVWTDWLPQLRTNPTAAAAVQKVAALTLLSYGDTSLGDAARFEENSDDRTRLSLLGKAVADNLLGKANQALPESQQAADAFSHAGNSAGSLRARFEIVYALQRAERPTDCLSRARSLMSDVQRYPYTWLRAQSSLELATCLFMSGKVNDAL